MLKTTAESRQGITVIFEQPGSLGLTFLQQANTNRVIVKSILDGSQAANHSSLCPGLALERVGSVDVSTMAYAAVIGLIKMRTERPLSLTFTDPRVLDSGDGAEPIENIDIKSTKPIKSQESTPPMQQAVSDEHAESIVVSQKELTTKDSQEQLTLAFVKPGPLGIRFLQQKGSQRVCVMGIKPGTQAQDHPQLRPGLLLDAIGTMDVRTMPYAAVVKAFRDHPERPLHLTFSDATTAQASVSLSENRDNIQPETISASAPLQRNEHPSASSTTSLVVKV